MVRALANARDYLAEHHHVVVCRVRDDEEADTKDDHTASEELRLPDPVGEHPGRQLKYRVYREEDGETCTRLPVRNSEILEDEGENRRQHDTVELVDAVSQGNEPHLLGVGDGKKIPGR